MSKSDEYRAKADECQRIARNRRRRPLGYRWRRMAIANERAKCSVAALPKTSRYFKLLTSSTVLYSAG